MWRPIRCPVEGEVLAHDTNGHSAFAWQIFETINRLPEPPQIAAGEGAGPGLVDILKAEAPRGTLPVPLSHGRSGFAVPRRRCHSAFLPRDEPRDYGLADDRILIRRNQRGHF